jgi:hypothetical protein
MNETRPLTDIGVTSGLARDGEGRYRGFITVTAEGENGDVLTGQMNSAELRKMALAFLEVAESADQDCIVATMLYRDVGIGEVSALGFISAMREERDKLERLDGEQEHVRESELTLDDIPAVDGQEDRTTP